MLVDLNGSGCGVDLDLRPTPWGEAMMGNLAESR